MRSYTVLACLAAVLLLACNEATAPDGAPELRPAADFLQGPADLPNIIRYATAFSFNIQDPETRLMAVAGLPDDPQTTWIPCGGTEPRQTFAVQNVGVAREAINLLAVARDIPIYVYDLNTFTGVCNSTPVASGVGRGFYVDNDRFASGTRTNMWGYRIVGRVELASGGWATLAARAVFMHHPADDNFYLVTRSVQLHSAP